MGRTDAKTLPTLLKRLNGHHHAHGCRSCNLRYTDACETSHVDGRCQSCRSTHGRAMWDVSSDPAACCYAYSKEATLHDRGLYDLAGERTWYRCTACCRTHPYQPVSVEEPAAVGGTG